MSMVTMGKSAVYHLLPMFDVYIKVKISSNAKILVQ